MGYILLVLLVSKFSVANADFTRGSWSQPPAFCPEEIIPVVRKIHDTSLDYLKEFPLADSRDDYEDALIAVKAIENIDEKVHLIYREANRYKMPPAVLLGSLIQESSLDDDGLSLDGGNFACGIAQLNVVEWCSWGRELSPQAARKIHFPQKEVQRYEQENRENFCLSDELDPKSVEPFFRLIGERHLDVSPNRIPMKEYTDIPFSEIQPHLVAKLKPVQHLVYKVARSFFAHCSDHRVAIPALASTLNEIYRKSVPEELKTIERYSANTHFEKSCQEPILTDAYPLNTGWLLADVIFNAGELVVPEIDKRKPVSWENFNPSILIETLKTMKLDHHITRVVNRASQVRLFPDP